VKRLALALVLTACGSRGSKPAEEPKDLAAIVFSDDPVAVLADLEDRLAAAREVEVIADVHAEGALTAEVHGELHVERERVSWIKVKGWFVDQPVQTKWSSLTPLSELTFDVTPPEWAEGLLVGAVRMGTLHNWAMVMSEKDPDIGHGDVRSWVLVEHVAWAEGGAPTRTLTWTIVVDGIPTGEVALELDERMLPLRRRQVVHFPQGDMRVEERYRRFDVVP